MKHKLVSMYILLIFLFTSLVSVDAIAPTPRLELDEYSITVTDINNITISGTVSIGKGQLIGLYDSTESIMYNYTQVDNTNSQESFTLKVPSRYLKNGNNTFKVKSLPLKGVINGSNPKTLTIKVKTSKKDQTITANDISLTVNEKKNLNAKTNSNLKLTYISKNPNIATVDYNGNVVGRKVGTTDIEISQEGNNEYNPAKKIISVKVKDNKVKEENCTITYNSNGGTGTIPSKTVKKGKNVAIAKNKFKKSGYIFTGWSTSKKGDVVYEENKVIKLNKNMTLYAHWEKDIVVSKKSLTNLAFKLAYPYGTKSRKASYKHGKPTSAYKSALHKYYKGQHFWSTASKKGASCDVFVGTVVRASGYDSKFPKGLGSQIPYMNSSKKWKKIKWDGKESSLRSGDILYNKYKKTNRYNNGHIYMYVKKNGKGYIASASAGQYYGKILKYTNRSKLKKVKYLLVYRATNAKIR